MIEIHVKVRVDTNDPREAYLQVMGALAFSGHRYSVSDYWLINGQPLPKTIARAVKGSYPERQVQELQTFVTCDECDEPLDGLHLPECGKRIVNCPDVVEDDCEPEEVDWRDKLRIMLRGIDGLPELRIDHPEEMFWPSREAMVAFNELIFSGRIGGSELPEGCMVVAASNREPEYTPMFMAFASRHLDMEVGPPWNEERSQLDLTYIDFDVGTAEGEPLSEIDVEIHDLLSGLRQAE